MYSKVPFFSPKKISFSTIIEIHSRSKPSFIKGAWEGTAWRHKSMGETLDYVSNPTKYYGLQQQAIVNFSLWKKNKSSAPSKVEVIRQDWGQATFNATKKHGVIYTVLNMANSRFPGGAALEGGSAQEENMWHRSTCVRSLLDDEVYLSQTSKAFEYKEYAQNLLAAKAVMTDEELTILNKHFPLSSSPKYKVFVSAEPRICFRGQEIGQPADVDSFSGATFHPDPEFSYAFLPKSEIFPFYELRSAAPELVHDSSESLYGSEKKYQTALRQRIAAQLDTLILSEKTHVILGAWGCGAFRNDPKIVAQIYSEEIDKRSSFFQHIVFPIIAMESRNNNFSIFHACLSGITLGDNYSAIQSLRC